MKTYLRKLTEEELKVLTAQRSIECFTDGSEVFCLDEVPQEVTLLIEGEITILKNDEDCLLVTPGYVLGLRQLMNGEPCRIKCRTRNAKAIKLAKDDFHHGLSDEKLSTIFGKLVAQTMAT